MFIEHPVFIVLQFCYPQHTFSGRNLKASLITTNTVVFQHMIVLQ